jgi:hypothetical protein
VSPLQLLELAEALENAPADIKTRIARALAPYLTVTIGASSPLPDTYSTRVGCAPAGWNDEKWKETAPTIAGAYKPPGSRWTLVPRSAFEAWTAAQSNGPSIAKPATVAAPYQWTAEDAMADLEERRRRRAAGGRR